MSSRRIPYWQRYLVRRVMDESVRFLIEDPVETLSYNSRPFVLGSLIRFLFCYSVFSLWAPWCFSSWVQLFALPCVALHVTLHSWWLPCNIPAPFPVPSPAYFICPLHHEFPLIIVSRVSLTGTRLIPPTLREHSLRDSKRSSVTPCFSCAFPRTLCFVHLYALAVTLSFRMRSLAFLEYYPTFFILPNLFQISHVFFCFFSEE